MNGFLIVNKPPGPTSFTVVKRVRSLCAGQRAGHAGTLDPAASGLLIVAIGFVTRLLEYIPTEPKRYEFTVVFGAETDTLDDQGRIVRDHGDIPSQNDLESVLARFIGPQMQLPPRFSALNVNGQRAYTLARNEEEFTLEPRRVIIHDLIIKQTDLANHEARLEVLCSTGTYVRSLARDIATGLGTFGHARGITRTASGPFTLAQAVDFASLCAPLKRLLISPGGMLASCSRVTLTPEHVQHINYGKDIELRGAPEANGPLFGFNDQGELITVLTKINSGLYHPDKVFL